MDCTRRLKERTGRDSTGNSDFGDNYLSKHVLAVSKISRDDLTAKTEEVEFEKIYKLVTIIPPTDHYPSGSIRYGL